MNEPKQEWLQTLTRTVREGARLYFHDGKNGTINIGAVEWCPGRGLAFAEMGAQHQGHVHLLPASRLAPDGETAFDFFDGKDNLLFTIYPEDELAGPATIWQASIDNEHWRYFWKSEVDLHKTAFDQLKS